MSEKKPIPAAEAQIELLVSNSRFIACLSPAFSVKQACEFIKSQKALYPDASHHVSAYIIGHGSSTIAHSTDDGEPSGTAGRPALAVLQGSGFGDVVVVVTRYFGGTKLGTGGLVRAYGDAVREVLKTTPRAQKISTQTVAMTLPYNLYEQVTLMIENHNGILLEKDFTAEVRLQAQFKDDDYPAFEAALTTLSHARISPQIISHNPETIFPLS